MNLVFLTKSKKNIPSGPYYKNKKEDTHNKNNMTLYQYSFNKKYYYQILIPRNINSSTDINIFLGAVTGSFFFKTVSLDELLSTY